MQGSIAVAFRVASRDVDPPSAPDLVPERVEVADANNAYTHFNAAVAALDWTDDEESICCDIIDGHKEYDPNFAADLLARNAEALKLLDRGLRCQVCQGPEVHSMDDSLEYLQNWRQLCRLLCLKAIHDRKSGRWADATNDCRDLLRLGNLVQKDAGNLVHYLVGVALLRQAEDMSRKLVASNHFPRSALRRLSQAISDVTPLDHGLRRSLKGDYHISTNTVDQFFEGKAEFTSNSLKKLSRSGYCFQPNKTKAMFVEVYRNYIENAPLPVKDRKLIHVEEQLGFKKNRLAYFLSPNNVGRTMLLLLLPGTEAVLEASTRSRGDLAATKIIVASRRYEIDHGELPPTLDALVPDYLDAVPADPYDGRPMRYDRDRAIIYSIGKDLIDSGGSELLPGESSDDENVDRWEAQDAVFHIHGRPETGKDEASVGQAMPDGRD